MKEWYLGKGVQEECSKVRMQKSPGRRLRRGSQREGCLREEMKEGCLGFGMLKEMLRVKDIGERVG